MRCSYGAIICASLAKFYKLNVCIIPASLYLKVKAIFTLPSSTVYFYEISRFLRIFNNSIIEDYKLFLLLVSSVAIVNNV